MQDFYSQSSQRKVLGKSVIGLRNNHGALTGIKDGTKSNRQQLFTPTSNMSGEKEKRFTQINPMTSKQQGLDSVNEFSSEQQIKTAGITSRDKLHMLLTTLEEIDSEKKGTVKMRTFTRLMQLCGLPFIEEQMRDRVLSRFTNSQTQLIEYQKACTAFKLIYRMRAGVNKNQIIKTRRQDTEEFPQAIPSDNFISVQDQDLKKSTPQPESEDDDETVVTLPPRIIRTNPLT